MTTKIYKNVYYNISDKYAKNCLIFIIQVSTYNKIKFKRGGQFYLKITNFDYFKIL